MAFSPERLEAFKSAREFIKQNPPLLPMLAVIAVVIPGSYGMIYATDHYVKPWFNSLGEPARVARAAAEQGKADALKRDFEETAGVNFFRGSLTVWLLS